MKCTIAGLIFVLILSSIVSAQTIICNRELGTCPPDFPPDTAVTVGGHYNALHAPEIFLQDADWYFYDSMIDSWSVPKHSQIKPLSSDVFNDEFDQHRWEEYLKNTDTAIHMTADGNRLFVMDEMELHLIDIQSGFVFSLPYIEFLAKCESLDGTSINWYDWVYREGAHVFRCSYSFYFAERRARMRIIDDAQYIVSGALNVLDSTLTNDFEKVRPELEHHLRPPEIWFFDSSDYMPGVEYFLKLDGTYADDLNEKTLGPLEFIGMTLSVDRLVRVVDLGQREYENLPGWRERYVQARHEVVNLIDRILTLTPGTWLIWVETGDDNILIRNLSNMYAQEEKQ